ncbi:MAG: VOC family protein [Chloroflexi bacterium]|nr:MAG: VOC family protein [Chloroflexota bacterium]
MINRIRLTSVWVNDQDIAYDFYVNKLGFSVQSDVSIDNGYRWLEVKPEGADTAIAIAKPYPGQEMPIGVFANITFGTDDIQASYEDLRNKGVHFTEAPARQLWGGMQALFTDPDGNTFVLVERED